MPIYKKDIVPIGRGGVIKHRGKGGTEQRVPRGGMDAVTGPPSIGRMLNNYAKPAPAPPPAPMPAAGPMPMPPDEG